MSSSKLLRQFQQDLTVNTLVIFQWLVAHFPRKITFCLADILMTIAYPFLGRMRKIAATNLINYYRDEADTKFIRNMTKESLKNIGRSMIDMLYYVDRPQEFSKVVNVQGLEHLEKAMSQSHGVIAVTSHLGNFPLLFMTLVQMGFKVNVIIRPMRNPDFGNFMKRLTDKWGINMIETRPRKSFLRKSLQSLKNKELLFILLDEDYGDVGSVEVEFLRKKAAIALGPLLFHNRTQAPILSIFMAKQVDMTQKIIILPEINVTDDFDNQNEVAQSMRKIMEPIEDIIVQYPRQWGGWTNKRWKQIPDVEN